MTDANPMATALVELPEKARTVSEARRQAARSNGARSIGPISTDGKAASARNSLKHGMTGAGKVLPIDVEADVRRRYDNLAGAFHPRDDNERDMLEQAALAASRIRRLGFAEAERSDSRYRSAVDDWERQRADQVDDLIRLLDTEPARAVRGLRATSLGCERLADGFLTLAEAVAERGRLSAEQIARGLALIGVGNPEQLAGHQGAQGFKAMADFLFNPGDAPGVEAEIEETRAELSMRLDEAVRELLERAEYLWERIDRPDRDGSPKRSFFDPTPEGRLLMRYLIESERAYRSALTQLRAYRRHGLRAPSRRPLPPIATAPPVQMPAPETPAAEPVATPTRPERNEPNDLDAILRDIPLPLLYQATFDVDPTGRTPATRPADPPERRAESAA